MVYYYQAKNFKKSQKWFPRSRQIEKNWPFDLAPPSNRSFWDIEILVILKALIASTIMPKMKKIYWSDFEIFLKMSVFMLKISYKGGLGLSLSLLLKSGSVTFKYLWRLNIMSKSLTGGSWEIGVTNRQRNGRMNGQGWNYRTLPLKRGSKTTKCMINL